MRNDCRCMGIEDALRQIADSLTLEGNCTGDVQKVLVEAGKRNYWGERVLVQGLDSPDSPVLRYDRNGNIKTCNYHEAALFAYGDLLPQWIVDLDTQERVYRLEDYPKCFVSPEKISIGTFEDN